MALIRVTMTSKDGRLFPMALSSDDVLTIEPDQRLDVPSKTVIKQKSGKLLFVSEEFDTIMGQLSL